MKRYENIDKAICHELEKLDKKYAANVEMTTQDVELIRLLRSAYLKGQTITAMEEDREWDDADSDEGRSYRTVGRSYRRGRDAMGRYTSRDMIPEYSGHYPEWIPPYYR